MINRYNEHIEEKSLSKAEKQEDRKKVTKDNSSLISVALVTSNEVRRFPDGFLFGTATSSHQIEGAWDKDGKTISIWDYVAHRGDFIIDGSNADVACDSYHLYKRDVEMLRELGVQFYRFSISWPRIIPSSFSDHINEPGVQYYNNLINELLLYNIEPMATIYHWDLPQKLQEMGGWLNPHIVDWFGDYSRELFRLYGDRVKNWITINEPELICQYGHGLGLHAPGINLSGNTDYICAKNVLLAHARAYHIYDQEFRASQGGNIYISLSAEWYEAEDENDTDLIDEINLTTWGLYAHPIYSEAGDFPPVLKERVAVKSAEQGFFRARLPEFTPEEIAYVKGTSDIFGLNHYSTRLVYRNESVVGYHASPSYNDDLGVVTYQLDEWSTSLGGPTTMTKSVPWGFYKLLTKIRETYNNPPVIITENGFATHGGLEDTDRVDNYRNYLNAMLDAIEEGSDIRGYTAWSLMDNFEWRFGYTQCFGMYEVDFSSPERTRTPRRSAFVYKQIVRSRELDFDYEPDTNVMTID